MTVPSYAARPDLECLRTREVEVIRRLIEEKHCGTGQFEQQDLHPGLLSARQGLERLLSRSCELVPIEHAAGRFAWQAVAVFVAVMKDVEQRASE